MRKAEERLFVENEEYSRGMRVRKKRLAHRNSSRECATSNCTMQQEQEICNTRALDTRGEASQEVKTTTPRGITVARQTPRRGARRKRRY